ncbi:methyl-accepting chemotaxis protein [Acidaminobacter sp. JC074]|uniref:methyl-accepting chemotaxis protein n=1 Tax=Acidaminobacter sp. JC074 TaxID=2530199 RepID=UPI001F0F8563|nr:methyl-accepting chemotaxis protein [Acidaminobacter sp. JC074]
MKWFYNLKLSVKLISAFVIVALLAAVVGVVGYYNLHQIGNQKMIAVESLLRVQESFTRINGLENMVISPTLSIAERKNVLAEIEVVEDTMNEEITHYLSLDHADEELTKWSSVRSDIDAYLSSHETLVKYAAESNAYMIEDPVSLRYIVATRERDHYKWIWLLEDAIINESEFSGQLDGDKCALGTWLSGYTTESPELNAVLHEIDSYHMKVHESGEDINKIIFDADENKSERAYRVYKDSTLPNMTKVLEYLVEIDHMAERSEALFIAMTDLAISTNAPLHAEASDALTLMVDGTTEEALSAVSRSSTMITIFTVIAAILSVVLGLFISNVIKKPIYTILQAANEIADGNLDVDTKINTKDEIGELAHAFDKMTDNINMVMTNINASSDQVASGATQMSDSSMSLSQGATEQASSIQQLTASTEEISVQTKANAESAEKAKSISSQTYEYAQQGNHQMEDMLGAMAEINESSSNISKIIKVIDDIAFQTNILALNAAVEAARAGEHGKGFAVVAEEVRNLAARSADAAKETTAMIESSIDKVKVGTDIANVTSEALIKIVDGVSETTDIVTDIANASNEQALQVDQVNLGLAQISDVVQTTSATAEETAAASEELSGQANMLKGQVAKFKLKGGSHNDYDMEVLKMIENIEL